MLRIADLIFNEGRIDNALVTKDKIEDSQSINIASAQIGVDEIQMTLNKIRETPVQRLTPAEDKDFLIDNGRFMDMHISV